MPGFKFEVETAPGLLYKYFLSVIDRAWFTILGVIAFPGWAPVSTLTAIGQLHILIDVAGVGRLQAMLKLAPCLPGSVSHFG